MKNKFLLMLILFASLTNSLLIKAQDKNAEAIVSYTKAEEFYNSEKYDSCINELIYTENKLGETNSKILYLKIKAMLVAKQNNDLAIYEEDSLIKKFFSITNVQNYPSEKYYEIINLKKEFEAFASTRNPVFLKQNLGGRTPFRETFTGLKDLMPQGKFSNINDKSLITEVTIDKPLFKTGKVFWYAIALPVSTKPCYAYGLIFVNNFIDNPLAEEQEDSKINFFIDTYSDAKGGRPDKYHCLKNYSKHRFAGMGGIYYGTGKEGVVFNTTEISSQSNTLYLVFFSKYDLPIKINYFFSAENTSLDLDQYFSIGGDNLEKLGFDKKNTSYGNNPNYKFKF